MSNKSIDRGWFEPRQPTRNGTPKSPEHVIASEKGKIASQNILTAPMQREVEQSSHTDYKIPAGWESCVNGYHFSRDVAEKHTADTYESLTLHGSIQGNIGTLILWTYYKDISDLKDFQERAGILEARLAAYTIEDPQFVTISHELHHNLFQIRKLKKDLKLSVSRELKLEETYYDRGYEQDRKARYLGWCIEFMEKANEESGRLITENNRKDPVNTDTYNNSRHIINQTQKEEPT